MVFYSTYRWRICSFLYGTSRFITIGFNRCSKKINLNICIGIIFTDNSVPARKVQAYIIWFCLYVFDCYLTTCMYLIQVLLSSNGTYCFMWPNLNTVNQRNLKAVKVSFLKIWIDLVQGNLAFWKGLKIYLNDLSLIFSISSNNQLNNYIQQLRIESPLLNSLHFPAC